MRDRRSFATHESGVSPTVGTILLVAIVVVLAGGFFVFSRSFTGNSSDIPTVKLAIEENRDRLVVNSASAKADWNRLAIRLTGFANSNATIRIGNLATCDSDATQGCVNVDPDATGKALSNATNVELSAFSDTLMPGEFLAFCYDNSGIIPLNVQFLILDSSANRQVGDFQLLNLSTAC